MALWSIGFGLLSIIAPFMATFYFPLLSVVGLLSAIRAIQRGLVLGGVAGIVLNLIGAVVTLIASGILFR